MKRTIIIVIGVSLCNATVCIHDSYGCEGDVTMIKSDAHRLLSGEQLERERSLQALNVQQIDTRREFALVLEEAARKRLDNDRRYMSPLHCAIQAVAIWRVHEAEHVLLRFIDYKLDVASLPVGIDVGEDFFYPAASALVSLRIEPRKVVDAIIVRAESDRQVKVLTWLLTQRTGSIESSITLIEGIIEAQGENPHLVNSVEFLKSVEHRGDLLID